MSESVNKIIFPFPHVKKSYLVKFRENIVLIPTKNETEKIPVFSKKKKNLTKF
jgi:hypothetical protein